MEMFDGDCGSACLVDETVAWTGANVLVLVLSTVWEIKHGRGVVYEVRGQVPRYPAGVWRGFDAKIDRKHDDADAVFVCSSSSSLPASLQS